MNRRKLLQLGGMSLILVSGSARALSSASLYSLCRQLEADSGGRIGVYVRDGRKDQAFWYRADERFAMCSTFKWLLAAAVLGRVDAGQEKLSRLVQFRKADLMEYSPVTAAFADGPGISIAQLCEAAITESDNTAANLLLETVNGPEGVNAFLRSRGDTVTRLDRKEPDLNEARPGDIRDTTTSEAMGTNLQHLLMGGGLAPNSRKQLTDWMLANRTSDARLRAALPRGWRLADKTGAGANGTANDVGVYWTSDGQPICICVFLTQTRISRAEQAAMIAKIGRNVREL